ncbi:SpoIID/LytB domain-containing protein [Nocardioides sp. BP30]|uniref:SpoIID/LytB domain-containing protein n=1 Tax=Nocardioides sp. BP30 TaxID=3036374 RepID=UPI0024696869|nr:SpoIID/LytB domain-containing protein [Nocardioides sp. BP30]WGL51671.1 SpoIID/LytB domain-containing protein [Nocardioides sp. BP30]
MSVRRPLAPIAGLVLGLLAAVLPLAAPAAQAKPGAVVTGPLTVRGNGYGHGHGMSQWGAEGAARQGLDYRRIVGFYYPGTAWGSATGNVRVLITADTTRSVVVLARDGLTARWVGHARTWRLTKRQPHATRWRIVPLAGGRSKVQYKLKAWHKLATVSGDLQFAAAGAPVTLVLPGHRTVAYRGTLRAASPHPGGLDRDTVNILPLDRYLQGVVPREMPALWHTAAVEAQAVAARTYAAFERAGQHGYYQICDTSACQVYGGYSGEQAASNAAVTATAGQILTYAGQPAFTQFSASNGGASLAGGQPYLVSQTDRYDAAVSPYRGWSTSVTPAAIEQRWPAIGQLTGVKVTPSSANAPGAGYVATVTLSGTGGSVTVSGDAFRSFAGLRSTWFSITLPSGTTSPSPSAHRRGVSR